MVCEVKQIESALSAAYVVAEEQKPIGKAEFPVNFLFGMPCDISYRDESYHLKYLAMASKVYRENNITLKHIVPYLIKHGEENYTERVYYKTTNKQLCAKYDPTFRKRAAQITTE